MAKTETLHRTNFRQSFQRGFDCRCRICQSEAIITYRKVPGQIVCDIIFKCPKCPDNQVLF